MVQILWDFRGESACLENTEDLVSGDEADLGDAVGVTQHNTDLGGCHSPAGEFVDLFDNFAGRGFEPGLRKGLVGSMEGRRTQCPCLECAYDLLRVSMATQQSAGEIPMADVGGCRWLCGGW